LPAVSHHVSTVGAFRLGPDGEAAYVLDGLTSAGEDLGVLIGRTRGQSELIACMISIDATRAMR
jgi:hypothetical protein